MTTKTKTSAEADAGLDVQAARVSYFGGNYEDALLFSDKVLSNATSSDADRVSASLLKASVLFDREMFVDSLRVLEGAGQFLDRVPPGLRAKFYGQRAAVNVKLGQTDGPMVDYEAARYWALDAGDHLTEASIRNNLARLYSECGRVKEAIAEVDSAIKLALNLKQDVFLGRFYDQKARILFACKRYVESLACSEKAMGLLSDHPVLPEARETHGKTLIALGVTYLDQADPITSYRARRSAAELVSATLDKELVELALGRCGGLVRRASAELKIQHSALLKVIEKYNLPHNQRRRPKTLIKR